MSNIIKSGRIRSRSVLELSNRGHASLVEHINEQEVDIIKMQMISELIQEKENELVKLEQVIQEKLADANDKVEVMLTKAREQVEKIKEEAMLEKNNILAVAYQQQEEILSCAESKVVQMKETALEEKRKMLQAVEGDVVETMITLLQHIISEELKVSKEWLKMVVRKMLLQEQISEPITLLISKQNMIALNNEKEELLANLSKLTAIEISDTLNDTTCILVTNQGNIEYDINEGLNKVMAELSILMRLSQE